MSCSKGMQLRGLLMTIFSLQLLHTTVLAQTGFHHCQCCSKFDNAVDKDATRNACEELSHARQR